MAKYRIVSDGHSGNTHVIDIETGKELSCVQSLEIKCTAPGIVECKLTLLDVELDIIADDSIQQPPPPENFKYVFSIAY